jgi:hypothetical protein
VLIEGVTKLEARAEATTLGGCSLRALAADEASKIAEADGEAISELIERETTWTATELVRTPDLDDELDAVIAEETIGEEVMTPAMVSELEAITAEEDEVAATELEETTEELDPVLAHAKLIFVTKAPELFGPLRSHVMST